MNAAKVAKTDKDQRLIYVSVRSSFEPVGLSSHVSCRLLGLIPNHHSSTRVLKV